MRLVIPLFALVMLGCTVGNQSIAPGEARALKAAEKWLASQGIDPKAVEMTAEPGGTGWSVLVERQPPTPGAHTFLRFDSKGKLLEVVPGA